MKILDRYLLKSFLITFTTVFVILFFIFVLQVVWLFISELAGKDLDIVMILKFLLFKMPSIIPLVLPLSVLLASIMTFGSLAENYEFAAMKSSGISLQRAMRSLTAFILLLSIVAFFFANNVIPFAEYKFINFRRNIAQVKPAMAIAEGQFSEVGAYNIKVEKKSGDNGRYLSQVTIHKKSQLGAGSNTVIKAKKGELVSSEDSNVLKLVLNDGNYYEDIPIKKFEDRDKMPFAKSEFQRYVINIDLSKLNNTNINEEKITNTNTMLNVSELSYTLDSLQNNFAKDIVSYTENISQRSSMTLSNLVKDSIAPKLDETDLLKSYSESDRMHILRVANSNIDAVNFSLETSKYELQDKQKNINQHWIALYDKFVIAYACLLMFFIGAPLGAIIRKGGLGLPIVFAVLIFIIFHFINTFGKKVAQQDEISPFLGCWMSSFVLTPLAIILTKRATDDKGFSMNFDWLSNFFNRIFPDKTVPVLATQGVTPDLAIDAQEVHQYLNTLPADSKPKAIVEEKVLPTDNRSVETLLQQYNLFSLVGLLSNLILLGVFFWGKPDTLVIIIIAAVVAMALFFSLYKAQQALRTLAAKANKKADIPLLALLAAGFPFYVLFYVYNRILVKQLITTTNTTV
ncbi:YjgP/YjgQ family permease [Flavobacterium sp. IMCC34852]|uniref:YjgP/YjgQ family permease n=1 Tax=Flavobacterium rivulicola TaxID=2732161 RepID=A0A7Y3R7X9_9FLAO|nr:YjgP/YjgQ family permease [Flavobacterium sp. IMCC34852]